jgi:hypothetical protein
MTNNMPIEYPFEKPTEENEYCLFPGELEHDDLIAFHGTLRSKYESILKNGFVPKAPLESVSFSKLSNGSLDFACKDRSDASPEGIVLVVRFEHLDGIVNNVSDIHVIRKELLPPVIGYCVVQADYVHC